MTSLSLCSVKSVDAIGNRDSLIDMIEEWHQDMGGKMTHKYAALQKALGLKELSVALCNTMAVVKILLDQSS